MLFWGHCADIVLHVVGNVAGLGVSGGLLGALALGTGKTALDVGAESQSRRRDQSRDD